MYRLQMVLCLALIIPGCWLSAPLDSGAGTDTGIPEDTDDDDTGDSESETESDTDTETSTEYCADSPWDIERVPINMLALVDRSRSMYLNMIGSRTFAEVVAETLSDMVATYDASDLINFGLAVFPSPLCRNLFDDEWDHVCQPSSEDDNPIVDIAPDNAELFEFELDNAAQCGGTPTSESLLWAKRYLSGDRLDPELSSLPTYVLLATDGAPNCNEELNVFDCVNTGTTDPPSIPTLCLDDQRTYDAARALSDAGYPVFVLGVGDTLSKWNAVMNTIAKNGSTDTFYLANDILEFQNALDEIANETVSCTYSLDWKQIPDFIDGSPVVRSCGAISLFGRPWSGRDAQLTYMRDCDGENPRTGVFGWNWQDLDVSEKELDEQSLADCDIIELCPEACNRLKVTRGGWKTVTAQFSCIQ